MIWALALWLVLGLVIANDCVPMLTPHWRGWAAGVREASFWIEDARALMDWDSKEYRWATGTILFLRQLADERAAPRQRTRWRWIGR